MSRPTFKMERGTGYYFLAAFTNLSIRKSKSLVAILRGTHFLRFHAYVRTYIAAHGVPMIQCYGDVEHHIIDIEVMYLYVYI